jgi:hypothetical protein
MKRLTLTICAAAFLMVACNNDKKTDETKTSGTDTTTTTKMDETKPETYTMPDSATMMKNWQAYATPGKEHAMMAKSNGTWTGVVTIWTDPAKPPQTSTSTAVNKMIMNGLYQQSTNTGNMMGMPFNGMGITGFDNHKKVFVNTWIDNMGSGIMNLEGPYDEATKTVTLKGKVMDAGIGHEINMRETYKFIDDNTQEMEMFMITPDGKETKTLNIKFTRKK